MSESASTRQRFIAGMCEWNAQHSISCAAKTVAVEAFADAECGHPYNEHPEFAHGGVDSDAAGTGHSWSKPHSSCRAALLKECGL